MASVYLHSLLLLLSFLFFSLSLSSPLLFLPLSKHPQTNLHLTHLFHTNLLLDLTSPFLWITPPPSPTTNSTAILRRSLHCSAAGTHLSPPPSSDDLCTLSVNNPITGQTGIGQLLTTAVDFLHVSVDEVDFLHVSAPSVLLSGLPVSVNGVFGLGRNRVGVVEQFSHNFNLLKKFSICLSSSTSNNGLILFGQNQHIEVSKSMIYTPILMGNNNNNNGDFYHIKLKSIKVQNKKLLLEELTTIQISTISPYTLVKTKIYKEIINAFAKEAENMGMIRVNPIMKFKLCYKVKEEISNKKIPVIDLVLQSEMVKWRINGHNSMVKVNNGKIMCLGILDGGDELKSSIILGIHQLEDHLIDFDLGSLMMGFTSSLVIDHQSSCSQLSSSMRRPLQSGI